MALDYTYLQVSDGTGDAALMHVTSARSIGSTVIDVDTVVAVPAKFIATSGTLASTGFIDPATVTNFYGHTSGSTLVIDGYVPGSTDGGNTVGQVVAIKPNTAWANLVANITTTGEVGKINVNQGAWTDWTPNPTGFTGTINVGRARYLQLGKIVFCTLEFDGTSNATTMGFTLPVAAKNSGRNANISVDDNSTWVSTGVISMTASSMATTVSKDANGTPFTSSGTKALEGNFMYEAA